MPQIVVNGPESIESQRVRTMGPSMTRGDRMLAFGRVKDRSQRAGGHPGPFSV
jgi:hypothetical protein